ncbi:cupin domain-containing protein [Mahella australiensis]|uniref:Cupin 2 conserved barrel domain protein n=1 Tax=Mahella australiensis (strain DSM 15567 / CIP 107919 / 50-1 BON) TaxID=697281 RepID=F3ZZR7_MAHA5|nr:cupin domain-containing protein [Mahella australiensis]AEE97914.1 Cupin 2 conserved barrel domain protein [Mahella australiensis 50-1 BON]
MESKEEFAQKLIFPVGPEAPEEIAENFIGRVYLYALVPFDSPLKHPVSHVVFEPRCRNNWHKHPRGQILLVTGGRGWYQEEGKEARELHAGDVVEILPSVKHWHGAAADSWFAHIAMEADMIAGPPEWLEPMSDEQYNKLR